MKLQREGAMCAIPVTFDPREVFGKLRAPVKVMLNGYSYRSTIFSMGGATFIPLRKSNREAAGLEGSETLRVTIALDLATREVAIPSDLARAMRAAPGTKARWDALSYTQRREFAEAIAGAKKPETRARRVAKALAVLKARR
ncbi:MAG TPA: YdeI/OmpD-associated family protein [Steroidobacteraceae bacterium]|nr:YdeI/OmpD-associated family protein [Steroidobacteraceae bacterium]